MSTESTECSLQRLKAFVRLFDEWHPELAPWMTLDMLERVNEARAEVADLVPKEPQ